MEIIPVIDIRDGIAVHAIRGEREKYQPLESVYATAPDPIEIALNLPHPRVYVADLNAITGTGDNLHIVREISGEKEVLLDWGVSQAEDIDIVDFDVTPVLGTETLKEIEAVKAAEEKFKEVFVSIDVKDGRLLSPILKISPIQAVHFFAELGVKKFILLELSRVGTLSSPDLSLINQIPEGVEVYIAGGVRNRDLLILKEIGVAGVLVGTALHKGEIKAVKI